MWVRVSHPGLRADVRALHLRAFGDTAARDVCPVRRPVGASFFLIPYAIELQPVGPATSYWGRESTRSSSWHVVPRPGNWEPARSGIGVGKTLPKESPTTVELLYVELGSSVHASGAPIYVRRPFKRFLGSALDSYNYIYGLWANL